MPYRWRTSAILTIALLVVAIGLLVTSFVSVIEFNITEGLTIDRLWYAKVETAQRLNEPSAMIRYLKLSLDGLESLDLQPTDYTAFIPWSKTSYYSVDTVISMTYSVIDQCEYTLDWIDTIVTSEVGLEVNADVYNEKIEGLQDAIDDISDWQADVHRAWILKHNIICMYTIYVTFFGSILCFIAVVICAMHIDEWKEHYTQEDRSESRIWNR